MRRIIKITFLLICSTLFLFPFIPNALCITTQGDTTFGVDEGQELSWTVTGGIPEYIGYKYKVTIEDIYNGSYMSIDSFMIDATVSSYNKTEDSWTTLINDAFFVAANETQNFIAFESTIATAGLYFIIPSPINLTMIGEYALDSGYYASYLINGNKLTIEGTFLGTLHLTYNSDGILTKMESEFFGQILSVMTLGGGGGGGGIPFGYSFLIYTIIAIIGLVYLKKRNIK
ncbi:MAG: hypothetical protein ACFFCE_11400 [Promethearchaeota archaeon]